MRQTLLFLIIACACSSKPGNTQLYEQSAALHLTMVAQANDMKEKLHDFMVQPPIGVSPDSVLALLTSIQEWELDLVEVPGYEHPAEAADHSHHHEAPPEVTADQMLDIQQEQELRLNLINKRLMRLTRTPQ